MLTKKKLSNNSDNNTATTHVSSNNYTRTKLHSKYQGKTTQKTTFIGIGH